MPGIWVLIEPLSGTSFTDSSTVAEIVFQFIFLGGVLFGIYRLSLLSNSVSNGLQNIRYSTYALVLWYIFTIVDLLLHECLAQVAYCYIFFYWLITSAKFAADIFMLTGAFRVLSCLISPKIGRPRIWILAGEFFIIVLVITALYHLGSYLANEALWLNIADSDIIIYVSSRKDQFEAAFFIIQWFLTLFILIAIVFTSNVHLGVFPKVGYFAIAATAVLWIRSLEELVIVIHYHLLQNLNTSSVDAARYFVYGLCTSGFLILITLTANDQTCSERQDPVRWLIEEDCRRYVLNTVNDRVNIGGQPPVLANVFDDMKQDPQSVLSEATADHLRGKNPNTIVMNYVGRMEQRYRGLRPVEY